MFYILHGDEEFLRSEEVAKAKAQIASDGLGDLNVTVLDGRKLSLDELVATCSTLPFLASRRLIIVQNLLQRFDAPGRAPAGARTSARRKAEQASDGNVEYSEKLIGYLPLLPPSSRLFFVEGKTLSTANPILGYAQQAQKNKEAYIREFKMLDDEKLRLWLQQRSKGKGTPLTREACNLLVSFVGHDLRLLDQELDKLAAFAGYNRPITVDDIKALVRSAQEEDVFALVDALGARNREQAMRSLQDRLAHGDNELYLLTMIARQLRLILAAKDLAQEQKKPEEIGRELNIRHSFIVEKLLRQGQQFHIQELEAIQRRVLEIDQAIKTGRMEGALALELLVVEVCRRPTASTRSGYGDGGRARMR